MQCNDVRLCGYLVENFKFHHDCGIRVFSSKIEVERKSGNKDILLLQIPEERLEESENLEQGDIVIVHGEIRTHTYVGKDSKIHNKNYIYVDKIQYSFYPYLENNATISGTLVKKRNLRITPLGQRLVDTIIATKSNGGHQDAYIPVIFWNETAKDMFDNYNVGDNITVKGRLQSRDYLKRLPDGSSIIRTTFEVSTFKLIL